MLITKATELKNVLVLYTDVSLMLCAHSLYCDMSQLIVLLAFGNVPGLNKSQTFIIYCYNLQLNVIFYYIIVAFLLCILQCATRSKVQILAHYTYPGVPKGSFFLTIFHGS